MKKSALIFAAAFYCLNAGAQLREGRTVLIGDASYYKTTTRTVSTGVNDNTSVYRSGTASLRFGYMVSAKMMVGVYGGYQGSGSNVQYINNATTVTFINTTRSLSNTYSAGFFGRYYPVASKDGKLALMLQLMAGYGMSRGTGYQSTSSVGNVNKIETQQEGSHVNVSLNPGVVYFLKDWLAIEASFGDLSYHYSKIENYTRHIYNNTRTQTDLGFSAASSTFNLGFNLYFGGKKTAIAPEG